MQNSYVNTEDYIALSIYNNDISANLYTYDK